MNSTFTEEKHIHESDLSLYVMHLLSEEDADAVVSHAERCSACRRDLAEAMGDLALYALAVEPRTPPAQARERLMKQIAKEKKFLPVAKPVAVAASPALAEFGRADSDRSASALSMIGEERPKRNLAVSIVSWAGWAVAAGVAVAAVGLMHERDALRDDISTQTGQIAQLAADSATGHQVLDALTDPTAMRVTLTKPKSTPAPVARATYNAKKGTLIFLASDLDPLQMYKVYELWLIPADGRDPMPAGTFHPDAHGNASVIMPALPKGVEAKAFGVTVEDDGGSQTPTQPIVLVGS